MLTRCALIAGLLGLGALATAELRHGDAILFNGTASMPIGFYVRASDSVSAGAIVTIRAMDAAPDWASTRGFDADDRFLKRIAATRGDRVCAIDNAITINGETVALRRTVDRQGHALPSWQGCFELQIGQIFLLGDASDSFDSRYFGVVSANVLDGVWRPWMT